MIKIKLKIYNLEGEKEYFVNKITLPTYLGKITVLPNHQPLLVLLDKGKIIFWEDDKKNEVLVEREAFARISQKIVEIFMI
jgi:F0F1-type ATP synthase epsilon subunit